MHLADISGDLSAETTNGSIILDRIDSGNVDLYTVNGNISPQAIAEAMAGMRDILPFAMPRPHPVPHPKPRPR